MSQSSLLHSVDTMALGVFLAAVFSQRDYDHLSRHCVGFQLRVFNVNLGVSHWWKVREWAMLNNYLRKQSCLPKHLEMKFLPPLQF